MTDESVFAQALAIGSPSERAAYLDRACAGDPALRAEVEALLAAHGASNPLDRPPADVAATGGYAPERPADPDEAVGAVLAGRYKLVERIGTGGMGAVYMAQQTEPVRRLVAVKVIRDGMDSRNVLARFEAERQALALMDHPNIARVLDAGTTDGGRPFFVMELVKGVPVTEFCDARKLSPRERLELFVPVCRAIQHAHQRGVIHRDIKPGNVLVALYDGRPVPKVIDFGVAKAAGQPLTDLTLVTGFGAVVGTPEYMSPEQAELNQLDIDTRSDVFALGVLLYELLTGSTPLDRARLGKAALLEVLRLVREEEPPKPSTRVSTSGTLASIAAARGTDPVKLSKLMRGELDWIVMKALEKDRNRRYESATALAKDVERHLAGDAVEACPPTLGYRLRKAYRRNRAAVRVACGFLGLVVGAAGAAAGLAVRATQAERAAVAARDAEADQRAEALRQRDGAAAERDKATRANADLRLTHYAAQMNLIQAAHEARDLGRLTRLLDAQAPGPNEPDLRGPEWHYWNRRYHGHDRELRIPTPRSVVKDWCRGRFHGVGLSPDGSTAVVAVCGRGGGLTVRVWDAHRGQQKGGDCVVAPDAGPDVYMRASVIRFSPDSRTVAVESATTDKAWGLLTGQYRRRAHLVDLVTGAAVPVEDRDTTGEEPAAQFSDDLRAAALPEVDVERRQTRFRFRRLDDGKDLGTVAVRGLATAAVAPDHRHVLVRAVLDHHLFAPKDFLPGRRAVVLSYWELGSDRPVWEQEVTDYADGVCRLAPDGRTFHRMVQEEGYWRLRTHEAATGKALETRAVAADRDARVYPDSESAAPVWALSPDGRRIAYQTWNGLAVTDLGLSRPGLYYDTLAPRPLRHPVETLEYPPADFAFLPDGRLAAVWSGFDLWTGTRRFVSRSWAERNDTVLDDVVVRTWGLPPAGADLDRAVNPTASPDGRLFAFAPLRRHAGDGGAARVTERVCVLDADARCVFSADLVTRAAGASDVPWFSPIGFSADGRYLYSLGEFSGRWERAHKAGTPFLVWDLQQQKEIAPVSSPAGTTFFNNRLSRPPRAGDRIALTFYRNDAEIEGGVYGNPVPLAAGAQVIEFPSGRVVCTATVPPGVRVEHFDLDAQGVLVGYVQALTSLGDIDGKTIPVHEWDVTTGRYRGPSERKWPINPAPTPTGEPERWSERGNRAVRVSDGPDGTTAEVWDAGRRAPGGRPLFRQRFADVCELSPDGSRLMVRQESIRRRYQATMYCTTTGREVWSAPWPEGTTAYTAFGRWSPDGHRFWYGVDADGNPVGWDFRPITEPKK